MKKIIVCLMALFLTAGIACAQPADGGQEEAPGESAPASGQMIVHTGSLLNFNAFQFAGGTPIARRDLRGLLESVPGNEALVSKMRGWEAASYTLGGICFASLVTEVVFTIGDSLPCAGTVADACSVVALSSILLGCITFDCALSRKMQAVDRYNMHVMGLPVK